MTYLNAGPRRGDERRVKPVFPRHGIKRDSFPRCHQSYWGRCKNEVQTIMLRGMAAAASVLGLLLAQALLPSPSGPTATALMAASGSLVCTLPDEKDKPLKLPDGWKADDPLPVEKTN